MSKVNECSAHVLEHLFLGQVARVASSEPTVVSQHSLHVCPQTGWVLGTHLVVALLTTHHIHLDIRDSLSQK